MSLPHFPLGMCWYFKKERLHFGMQEIRRADVSSFQVLNSWWAKDRYRVYCAGSEVRGADVDTFRVLNKLYAVDSKTAYTIKGPIRESDVTTFEVVGETAHGFNTDNGYAKDANHVYHTIVGGKACIVKGADAKGHRAEEYADCCAGAA